MIGLSRASSEYNECAVSSEPGGAVSSEPGPARVASGVRAPANQSRPATQNIASHEYRARSRSRSRSEWGASARESVPAGDTGRSTSRLACRERVAAREQAYGPDHPKAAESDAQKVARRGDEVA